MRGLASTLSSSQASGFNIHSGIGQLRTIRQSDNHDRGATTPQISNQLNRYSVPRVIAIADLSRSTNHEQYENALRNNFATHSTGYGNFT